MVDEAGTILYVNARIASIFGYRKEELLGAPVETLVPGGFRFLPDSGRDLFHPKPRSRRAGTDRDLRGRRKNGSEVPVEIGLTLAGGDGPRLVVASVVDVSERKRLEREAVEAAERRLSFERLVSDLAARFLRIDSTHVDETIKDSLSRIAEALNVDRCALWQFAPDGDMRHTHLWSRLEATPSPSASFSARDRIPYLFSRVREDETVRFDRVEDVPSVRDRETMRAFGAKSGAIVPMTVDDRVIGAISFGTTAEERTWDADVLERLRLVAAVFAQVLARREGRLQLESALAEVQRLRDRLAAENIQLRHEVKSLKAPRQVVCESRTMRKVLAQVESVAATDASVLLLGETGCGKEVIAEAIHDLSKRRDRPMVRVNCAAIPAALLESELFGRERGAYTGALSRQIGRFELANGTTIFLDEVGDLPLEAQVKLLRVLQDHTLERLGSVRPIKVDVRVIAATNRDLTEAVAARTFREDLFYRLNVFPILVPPLRERPEDISVLIWSFVDEFSKTFGRQIDSISRESLAALQRYSWPGNVRELRNVIERAMIVARGPTLVIELPRNLPEARADATNLADVEAEHIRSVLKRVHWRIRGRGGAAELLGMKPTTLDSRMARLGIRRPKT